jgi:hypothetical protein
MTLALGVVMADRSIRCSSLLILSLVLAISSMSTLRAQATSADTSALHQGTIAFQVVDSATGYVIGSAAVAWGNIDPSIPDPLPNASRADRFGKVRLNLKPGHYAFEMAGLGYRRSRTHFEVTPGMNLKVTSNLDGITPPRELQESFVDPRLRPGFDLVHGFVVDVLTRQPVAGVEVHIEKVGKRAVTDARGYYELYAAAEDVSEAEDPPKTSTLVASAPGYKSYLEQYLIFVSGSYSIVNMSLERGTGEISPGPTPRWMLRRADSPDEPSAKTEPPHPETAPAIDKRLLEWLSAPANAPRSGPGLQ